MRAGARASGSSQGTSRRTPRFLSRLQTRTAAAPRRPRLWYSRLGVDEVEAALQQAWTRASAQHPEVELALDAYAAHAHTAAGVRGEALDKLHLEDLFLACA